MHIANHCCALLEGDVDLLVQFKCNKNKQTNKQTNSYVVWCGECYYQCDVLLFNCCMTLLFIISISLVQLMIKVIHIYLNGVSRFLFILACFELISRSLSLLQYRILKNQDTERLWYNEKASFQHLEANSVLFSQKTEACMRKTILFFTPHHTTQIKSNLHRLRRSVLNQRGDKNTEILVTRSN